MQTFHRTTIAILLVAALGGCGLSTDIARVKGYDALRGGKPGEAQKYFEKCVNLDATDWKSHYYLGRIGLDHTNDAFYARRHLEVCETIRKSMPDSQLAPRPGAPQQAVPWPTRHQIADALAESMFRQNLRARLNNYVRQQATEYGDSEDYLRVGRYLHALGDNDAAAVAYVQATMVAEADDPAPHVAAAGFYDAVGDRPAALLELRKAYFIDPMLKDLAENIRRHGMVPGPTIAIAPEREKPVIVKRGEEDPKAVVYPQPEGKQ